LKIGLAVGTAEDKTFSNGVTPGAGKLSAGVMNTSKLKFDVAKLGFGLGAGDVVMSGSCGFPRGTKRRRTVRDEPSQACRKGRITRRGSPMVKLEGASSTVAELLIFSYL
jgi:hypothetical protein